MESFQIIGLMSGTSMDGLDIAFVRFERQDKKWKFNLIDKSSVDFPSNLLEKIQVSTELSAPNLYLLDKDLGLFYAESVNDFIVEKGLKKEEIDAIASHGQTVFHQPEKGFTVQIGCGATLASKTGINVINDFRTKDVVHGGQGAPLVPIGDFELFGEQAEAFLNIGGIANISYKKGNKIEAFDICPGNLPLNKLMNLKGEKFDDEGNLARKGELNFFLLDLLNKLPYYDLQAPKSLGVEWLEREFYPLVKFDKEIESNLRTIVEHEATQIASILKEKQIKNVFVSGGGAYNTFLLERLAHYFQGEIIVPTKEIIEFKEAIIFAFLGLLRLKNEVNCLSEVTGASKNVCGGVLHLP